jgi:hypothetical protein
LKSEGAELVRCPEIIPGQIDQVFFIGLRRVEANAGEVVRVRVILPVGEIINADCRGFVVLRAVNSGETELPNPEKPTFMKTLDVLVSRPDPVHKPGIHA